MTVMADQLPVGHETRTSVVSLVADIALKSRYDC